MVSSEAAKPVQETSLWQSDLSLPQMQRVDDPVDLLMALLQDNRVCILNSCETFDVILFEGKVSQA